MQHLYSEQKGGEDGKPHREPEQTAGQLFKPLILALGPVSCQLVAIVSDLMMRPAPGAGHRVKAVNQLIVGQLAELLF
jgi:hypothetical protein